MEDFHIFYICIFGLNVSEKIHKSVLSFESVSCSVMSDALWQHDCSLPGCPVHGILQARIPDCVAIPFSRASSWSRDWTQDSCIASGFFTDWATREVLSVGNNLIPTHIKCPWYVPFWDSRYWAHIFMMSAQ